MEIKTAPLTLEEKDVAAGEFTGYGSVFENVDDGYDVIEPGAFKKFKKTKDGQIRMLLNHDRLLGKGWVSQDDVGLVVDGQINMKLSYAADTYELMKDNTLDGLSVGFNILPKGAEIVEDDKSPIGYVRHITKAELWEVSIVPFGMNPKARISSVKSAINLEDIRELEFNLRKMGYSRREAKAIASGGFAAVQRDAALPDGATLDELKATIAHFLI